MSLPTGIGDNDILEVLNEPKGKNDDLKMDKLRDVVVQLSINRTEVETILKTHIKDGSVDDLCETFLRALPADKNSKLSRLSTDDLANHLLPLIKFFRVFMDNKGNNKIPKIFTSLSNVNDIVLARVFDNKMAAEKKGFITGKTAEAERSRYYGSKGATIPQLVEYQTCVLCGHNYVDEPQSNQSVYQRNLKAQRDYKDKCDEINAQKKANPNVTMVNDHLFYIVSCIFRFILSHS